MGTIIKATTIAPEDAARWGFKTMASIDNPKGLKGQSYGYLNAILYMAPAASAGVGNLCPWAHDCIEPCLGLESGQAQIRKAGQLDNATTLARKARARAYMTDREAFMRYVVKDVNRLQALATARGMTLVYRFNGSTDVGVPAWLIDMFPAVTFIDYTKSPQRMQQYVSGKLPPNYHLTFSRTTNNERLADRFLAQGGNVAVVFAKGERPAAWHGFEVIDGDRHDIRTPQQDGRGKVIGLTPKGRKAMASTSGFVVRRAA